MNPPPGSARRHETSVVPDGWRARPGRRFFALVLLDEPTTGLDVPARQEPWAAIRAHHAGGGTGLLTSPCLSGSSPPGSRSWR